MYPIRVAQFGLGAIGQACVRALQNKSGLELLGAIDADPAKVGRDVGEVCGLDMHLGIPVHDNAVQALDVWRPAVVIHTTSSFLDRIETQLATIIRAGSHVVSSAEELFYPFDRHPDASRRLADLARQHAVAVVGTGVNPGFAMDLLPLCLTGVCVDVEHIAATRVVDAGMRREPLQRKIGAGLTKDEFQAKVTGGRLGHAGLRESAMAVMDTLGWPIETIEEQIEPVLTDHTVETAFVRIAAGDVAGLRQTLRVTSQGVERLVLDLYMYVGATDPRDIVEIRGSPPLSMQIEGGIFGDTATIGALINTIPKIMTAAPGLRTMMELPMPYAFL